MVLIVQKPSQTAEYGFWTWFIRKFTLKSSYVSYWLTLLIMFSHSDSDMKFFDV